MYVSLYTHMEMYLLTGAGFRPNGFGFRPVSDPLVDSVSDPLLIRFQTPFFRHAVCIRFQTFFYPDSDPLFRCMFLLPGFRPSGADSGPTKKAGDRAGLARKRARPTKKQATRARARLARKRRNGETETRARPTRKRRNAATKTRARPTRKRRNTGRAFGAW